MWILQRSGLVLMALALALIVGSGIYYLQPTLVDARAPLYAPEGGITSDHVGHGSVKGCVIVGALFFLAGLAAVLVSMAGQNQRAAQEVNRPATGGNDPWRRDTASAAKEIFARYRKRPPMRWRSHASLIRRHHAPSIVRSRAAPSRLSCPLWREASMSALPPRLIRELPRVAEAGSLTAGRRGYS